MDVFNCELYVGLIKQLIYRQIILKSNDFTEWIFTFLPPLQTISKKGWVKTFFSIFHLVTFPIKTLLQQKSF